jgi:hypothetical protein
MDPIGNRRFVVVPLPFVLSAVLAALALAIVLVVTNVAREAGSFNLNIVPKASAWNPDPGYWCAGLPKLAGPFPDPQVVATDVNSAPTRAARAAMLAFYDALVKNGVATPTQLAAVYASYTCPPS